MHSEGMNKKKVQQARKEYGHKKAAGDNEKNNLKIEKQ